MLMHAGRSFTTRTLCAFIATSCWVVVGAACALPGDVPLRVVTSACKEDVRWLQHEFPGDQTVVCAKRDCGRREEDDDAACSLPLNAGLETASYIKYITSRIDSGERLACETAFVHGHETAWHHRYGGSLAQAIRHSNATRSGGYVSLNARFLGPLPPAHLSEIADLWTRVVAPYMGPWPCASGLFPPCCAQFRVTRERILAVPPAAWPHWLAYSLEGQAQAKQFEFLWHVIFGQPCIMPVTNESEYISIHFQN
jgi:hypothetical protein